MPASSPITPASRARAGLAVNRTASGAPPRTAGLPDVPCAASRAIWPELGMPAPSRRADRDRRAIRGYLDRQADEVAAFRRDEGDTPARAISTTAAWRPLRRDAAEVGPPSGRPRSAGGPHRGRHAGGAHPPLAPCPAQSGLRRRAPRESDAAAARVSRETLGRLRRLPRSLPAASLADAKPCNRDSPPRPCSRGTRARWPGHRLLRWRRTINLMTAPTLAAFLPPDRPIAGRTRRPRQRRRPARPRHRHRGLNVRPKSTWSRATAARRRSCARPRARQLRPSRSTPRADRRPPQASPRTSSPPARSHPCRAPARLAAHPSLHTRTRMPLSQGRQAETELTEAARGWTMEVRAAPKLPDPPRS